MRVLVRASSSWRSILRSCASRPDRSRCHVRRVLVSVFAIGPVGPAPDFCDLEFRLLQRDPHKELFEPSSLLGLVSALVTDSGRGLPRRPGVLAGRGSVVVLAWSCEPSVWLAVARGFYLAGSDRSRVCAPCAGTVLSPGGPFVLISGLPWAYRGLRSPPATMACPLPHRGFTSMPTASSRRARRRPMRPGLCLRGGEPLESALIELPVGGLSLFGLEGA